MTDAVTTGGFAAPDDRPEPPEVEDDCFDRGRWESRVEPWAPGDTLEARE